MIPEDENDGILLRNMTTINDSNSTGERRNVPACQNPLSHVLESLYGRILSFFLIFCMQSNITFRTTDRRKRLYSCLHLPTEFRRSRHPQDSVVFPVHYQDTILTFRNARRLSQKYLFTPYSTSEHLVSSPPHPISPFELT